MFLSSSPQRIASSFSKASVAYAQHAVVQQAVGRHLLQLTRRFLRIDVMTALDLGCGDGLTTAALQQAFSTRTITMMDISAAMLQQASARLPAGQCLLGSFDDWPIKQQQFSLVWANMALQWASDLEVVIRRSIQSLQPGGLFVFAMPVMGTFTEIARTNAQADRELAMPMFFRAEEVGSICAEYCIFSEKKSYRQVFSSGLQALKSIKETGASGIARQNRLLTKHQLTEWLMHYEALHSDATLTYEIGFFIYQK